jgi:hypothetical protein
LWPQYSQHGFQWVCLFEMRHACYLQTRYLRRAARQGRRCDAGQRRRQQRRRSAPSSSSLVTPAPALHLNHFSAPFTRHFPSRLRAAAAWFTCVLVSTARISLASAPRPAPGSGCSSGMACAPLQLVDRQHSRVLGLFCDVCASSERFAQRA